MDRYKDNTNPPTIKFRMESGRIRVYTDGKIARGAGKILRNELGDMGSEVKHSVASGRSIGYKDDGTVNRALGGYSSFPSYYKELKFKSRKDFAAVLERKKGKRFNDLAERAISNLSTGRDSSFGRIPANRKFRVKTRQSFDNKDVVFRRIRGKIVPMRFKKKLEEAPF